MCENISLTRCQLVKVDRSHMSQDMTLMLFDAFAMAIQAALEAFVSCLEAQPTFLLTLLLLVLNPKSK